MSCSEGGSQLYLILEPLVVSVLYKTMARTIWESIHVTFDKNKKGTGNLFDPEE